MKHFYASSVNTVLLYINGDRRGGGGTPLPGNLEQSCEVIAFAHLLMGPKNLVVVYCKRRLTYCAIFKLYIARFTGIITNRYISKRFNRGVVPSYSCRLQEIKAGTEY